MVTVSHIVKSIVNSSPMLQDALIEEIISYANLAERLQPKVEAELGKKVKASAVMMALRRYAESLQKKSMPKEAVKIKSEIIMKTGMCDVCIVKTPSAIEKLKRLYQLVDFDKGDTLNIIHGNYELTIVTNQKYLAKVESLLKSEKIINIERDLVSMTLLFGKEFFYTPGFLSMPMRKLAWENINIYENISTMTELILIISERDSARAYNALQLMIKELQR